MGKTNRLGPALPPGEEQTPDPERQLRLDSRTQTVILRGSDLYRLNCWGCHGEFGLGAPPEINSVINPTRATSTQLILERMKSRGVDMSHTDAAQLANQSKVALLQRLHNGGTNMPPFPHLSEPEIHAIVEYLRQLAGIPGAEKQQAVVKESRLREGEHIVKSSCHICHNAVGPNPDPQQLFNGAIPPLNTLTTRTSLPEFERKIRSGAPIMMGTPPSPFRGRMPVFYYLSEDEVADAYLYLKLYPPELAVPDPLLAATQQNPVTSNIALAEFSISQTNVPPSSNARDSMAIFFPVTAEIFVALLFIAGIGVTFHEVRRATAQSLSRKALAMDHGGVVQHVSWSKEQLQVHSISNDKAALEVAHVDDKEAFQQKDYRSFESSWFSRWLEEKDEAA